MEEGSDRSKGEFRSVAAGDVVVVELGGAGGALPGPRVDRLRRLVLQLLPAGRPQLQAQEVLLLPLLFTPLAIAFLG